MVGKREMKWFLGIEIVFTWSICIMVSVINKCDFPDRSICFIKGFSVLHGKSAWQFVTQVTIVFCKFTFKINKIPSYLDVTPETKIV